VNKEDTKEGFGHESKRKALKKTIRVKMGTAGHTEGRRNIGGT
jgi:hypothetical protein